MTSKLFKRHHMWSIRYYVPADLWATVGKVQVVKSTGKSDKRAAEIEAAHIVPAIMKQLGIVPDRLRQRSTAKNVGPYPIEDVRCITSEAELLRLRMDNGQIDQDQANEFLDIVIDLHQETRADLDHQTGTPVADEFHQVAGDAHRHITRGYKGLIEYINDYLDACNGNIKEKSIKHKRRVLDVFAKHIGSKRDPRTITRQDKVQYIDEIVKPLKVSTKTKRDNTSHVSAFFTWLVDDRHVMESNPFRGFEKQLPESSLGKPESRRGFREDELFSLYGAIPQTSGLLPVMLIALYTGMRIEEVCRLKGTDYRDNCLHVSGESGAKNQSSVRPVPCHPIIQPLIAVLIKTSWDEYLISGLTIPKSDDKRSHAMSQAFRVWRHKVGIMGGDTTFHSLRHSFTTHCRSAEVEGSRLDRILGHKGKTEAERTYGGLEIARLKADIAKVTFGRTDHNARDRINAYQGNPPKTRKGRPRFAKITLRSPAVS